jgi:hypothetical protein
MHYATLVICNKNEDIESAVENILSPYQDKEWDWYQIGGRWTGLFDGYNPEKNPANIEICKSCNGTGDRKDLKPPEWKKKCGGCNVCGGTGKSIKWPTQWGFRNEDIIFVEKLTKQMYKRFYSVCIEDYGWFSSENYEYRPWKKGEASFKVKKAELPPFKWIKKEFKNMMAVIVDCHN